MRNLLCCLSLWRCCLRIRSVDSLMFFLPQYSPCETIPQLFERFQVWSLSSIISYDDSEFVLLGMMITNCHYVTMG